MSKYIYGFALLGVPIPLTGFYYAFAHPQSAQSRTAHSFALLCAIYLTAAAIAILPRVVVSALVAGGFVAATSMVQGVWACTVIAAVAVFVRVLIPALNAQFPAQSFGLQLTSAPTREVSPSQAATVQNCRFEDDSDDDEAAEIATTSAAPATAATATTNPSHTDLEVCWCDWRTVKSFMHLWVTVSAPPLAVINFGLSILTLFMITPILIPARPPAAWIERTVGDPAHSRDTEPIFERNIKLTPSARYRLMVKRVVMIVWLLVLSPIGLALGSGVWTYQLNHASASTNSLADAITPILDAAYANTASYIAEMTATSSGGGINLLSVVIAGIYVPSFLLASVMALSTRTIVRSRINRDERKRD